MTSREAMPNSKYRMVPGQPRPPARESMNVVQVQRWVLASLSFITLEHLAAGLVVAAIFANPGHPSSRVGLLLIAGAFGTLAIAAAFVIHKRQPLNWWLLLGLAPTVVGAFFCFGR